MYYFLTNKSKNCFLSYVSPSNIVQFQGYTNTLEGSRISEQFLKIFTSTYRGGILKIEKKILEWCMIGSLPIGLEGVCSLVLLLGNFK